MTTKTYIFLVISILLVIQAIGGFFQIKNYKQAIARMHKQGCIGIGQRRGKLFNGYLVIFASDSLGHLVACEVMDGISILAKFHPKEEIAGCHFVGMNVDELINHISGLGPKEVKRASGYIQALEALSKKCKPTSEIMLSEEVAM